MNYEAARGGDSKEGGESNEKQEQGQRKGFRDLVKDKRILIFTAAVVLFTCRTPATLPLVGEILSKDKGNAKNASWQIAAAVFVAEAVMVAAAVSPERKRTTWVGNLYS